MQRRFYYDIATGDIFFETNMNTFADVSHDISIFFQLRDRVRESFDCVDIEGDQYAQDFAECTSYRVNPETKTLEFSYPNPNEPVAPQPYQPPLSEQVVALKAENIATMEALAEVYEIIIGGA